MNTNNPEEPASKTANSEGLQLSNSDVLMCMAIALIVAFLFIAGGYYWFTNPDFINNWINNP